MSYKAFCQFFIILRFKILIWTELNNNFSARDIMHISMMVQIFINLTPLLPRIGCPAPKCGSEYTPFLFTILCWMLFIYIFVFEGLGSLYTLELGSTGRCAENNFISIFFSFLSSSSLSLSLSLSLFLSLSLYFGSQCYFLKEIIPPCERIE